MRTTMCLLLASAAAVMASADVAHACGGCFIPEQERAGTVVTGHRMALSVSQQQTVLWDQIQYSGDPSEFSWVLPVMPGARIEVAADAWFDVLDAATTFAAGSPPVQCATTPPNGGDGWEGGYDTGYYGDGSYGSDDGSSFGCGCGSTTGSRDEYGTSGAGVTSTSTTSSGAGGSGSGMDPEPPPPDVNVVHHETVGPYETVTLSTDIPGVLDDWLANHGYFVPPDIQPTIDAYVAEGFDFIAMRLVPGTRVRAMKPVRVISPGASFALPLRMVAAGTGANTALTLFVLSEGRYQAQNFPNGIVPTDDLVWDFGDSSSNYAELREQALAANDGHVWLTTYAKSGSLFSREEDTIKAGFFVSYKGTGYTADTIAEAYVRQGIENGEADESDASCLGAFDQAAYSMQAVIDTCDDAGNCAEPMPGEIAQHQLVCGPLDDVAEAMLGMHPADVWITRLEANLPREALASDLALEASSDMSELTNRQVASSHVGDPCAGASAPPTVSSPRRPPRLPPGGIVTLVLAAAFLAALRRSRGSRLRLEGSDWDRSPAV